MSDQEDMTREIEPTEVVGMYIARVLFGDAYCVWVPKWAWDMYNKKAKLIANLLKDWGITNESLKNSKRFNQIIERGY